MADQLVQVQLQHQAMEQLRKVRKRLKQHARYIRSIDGTDRQQVREWLDSVTSAKAWTQADDALTLEMVGYLSKGDVAVTIRNLVEEAQAAGQNATWDAVKDRLTELYLDDDERGYRRELVDNLR